ncbi:MAG TPA: ABC transporter permease [Devosiaceae bacterium]
MSVQTDITDPAPRPARKPRSRLARFIAWWADGWSRFSNNRLSVIGLVIVLLFIFAGLATPLLTPYGPFDLVAERLQPPSAEHWLGTDNLGRDVMSGVLYGTGTSMRVGFLSVLFSMTLGLFVGSIAGYYGGWLDDTLMRITEIFQVLPRFFLALIIVALVGANLWGTIFVIGILSWAEIARLVRAEFYTLRNRPFVRAAKAYGASDAQIIFTEILPNALTAVVVVGALQIPSAILLEASLSFIGAGDPNVMSWGRMLNTAQQYMADSWWTGVFPGLAISVFAMSLALLSDGINDFLNPRLRQKG